MIKRACRLLAMAAVVICGAAATASAHPGHSTPHGGRAGHSSPPTDGAGARTWAHAARDAAAAAEGRLEGKPSASKASKPGSRRTLKGAARARAIQEEIDLEESAGTCERARCSCTSSSHGTRNCYTNSSRGDCPTHVGILCIWAD
jgi:hypothetical protein